MAVAAVSAQIVRRNVDIDPSAGKRLNSARGLVFAVQLCMVFWAGFFSCAYFCLSRPHAEIPTHEILAKLPTVTPTQAIEAKPQADTPAPDAEVKQQAETKAQPLASKPHTDTPTRELATRLHPETPIHELEAINRQVNARMRYTAVKSGSFHGSVGSCIAYAVNKRDALIAAGWDPERLVVWGVLDSYGDRHAILVVDDDKILDMGMRAWAPFIVDLNYVKHQGYSFLHPLHIGYDE